jgi:ribosomal protein S18 acetylase RimI-like enzyme
MFDGVHRAGREDGLIHIRLWAPSDSAAALALYRHAGFQETGRRQSFTADADRQIVELEYGGSSP